MLFHITQTHTPELCPKDDGGSKALYNPKAEGVELLGVYGAFAEHILYYIVEADTHEAIQGFLLPGFKRTTCKVTPISRDSILD